MMTKVFFLFLVSHENYDVCTPKGRLPEAMIALARDVFHTRPYFDSYALVLFIFVEFLMHWHLKEKFRARHPHLIKDSMENFGIGIYKWQQHQLRTAR